MIIVCGRKSGDARQFTSRVINAVTEASVNIGGINFSYRRDEIDTLRGNDRERRSRVGRHLNEIFDQRSQFALIAATIADNGITLLLVWK